MRCDAAPRNERPPTKNQELSRPKCGHGNETQRRKDAEVKDMRILKTRMPLTRRVYAVWIHDDSQMLPSASLQC